MVDDLLQRARDASGETGCLYLSEKLRFNNPRYDVVADCRQSVVVGLFVLVRGILGVYGCLRVSC